MNEYLACLIIYAVFLIVSFFCYKWIGKTNWRGFWIFTLLYLVGLYGYFEGLNQFNYYLRDHGNSIDFGHAGLLFVLLTFFCYLNAFVLLFFIAAKIANRENNDPHQQ